MRNPYQPDLQYVLTARKSVRRITTIENQNSNLLPNKISPSVVYMRKFLIRYRRIYYYTIKLHLSRRQERITSVAMTRVNKRWYISLSLLNEIWSLAFILKLRTRTEFLEAKTHFVQTFSRYKSALEIEAVGIIFSRGARRALECISSDTLSRNCLFRLFGSSWSILIFLAHEKTSTECIIIDVIPFAFPDMGNFQSNED